MVTELSRCWLALKPQAATPSLLLQGILTQMVKQTLPSQTNPTTRLPSCWGTVFTAAALSPFTTGTGTTSPVALAAADFNGDGTADLAVVNSNKNNVGILLNQLTDTASVSITGVSVPGNGTSNHTVKAS